MDFPVNFIDFTSQFRYLFVITKPDKGTGVVVMDKSDYVRLLKESSISDETKFAPVSLERPKTRGRPPKFYHPLLQKENKDVT